MKKKKTTRSLAVILSVIIILTMAFGNITSAADGSIDEAGVSGVIQENEEMQDDSMTAPVTEYTL